MNTKLALIERHGTLDEFAKAVWQAQADGFCEVQEAVDAIAKYARELAQATIPAAQVIDPAHLCQMMQISPQRIEISAQHYEEVGGCEAGCCKVFGCRECGARIEVNLAMLVMRVLRPEAQ